MGRSRWAMGIVVAAAGCAGPAPARWAALEDHGCKPGTAFELWTSSGRVLRGSVSVVDPMSVSPEIPLEEQVRLIVPMCEVEQQGSVLRFRFPPNLIGGFPEGGEVVLGGELGGPVGARVQATVRLDPVEPPSEEEGESFPVRSAGAPSVILFERLQ